MVTFTKRKGKIVGMSMSFAEMRVSYKLLTSKTLANDDFQTAGKELMEGFTEQQIRDAVDQFPAHREAFLNGTGDF